MNFIVLMVILAMDGGVYAEYTKPEKCLQVKAYFERSDSYMRPRVDCVKIENKAGL